MPNITLDFMQPTRAPAPYRVDPTISSAYAVHRGEMALGDWIEFDVAHDGGRYALALE